MLLKLNLKKILYFFEFCKKIYNNIFSFNNLDRLLKNNKYITNDNGFYDLITTKC